MCRVSLSFSTSETRGKRERFRYDNRATRHVRDNTDCLPLWLTPPPSLALTPSSSPPRSVWDESHHHLRGGVSDYTRSRVRCPQTRLLPSASIIQRVHTLWIMSHNGGCVPVARTPRCRIRFVGIRDSYEHTGSTEFSKEKTSDEERSLLSKHRSMADYREKEIVTFVLWAEKESRSFLKRKKRKIIVRKKINKSFLFFVSLIACNKISRGSTIEFNWFCNTFVGLISGYSF